MHRVSRRRSQRATAIVLLRLVGAACTQLVEITPPSAAVVMVIPRELKNPRSFCTAREILIPAASSVIPSTWPVSASVFCSK